MAKRLSQHRANRHRGRRLAMLAIFVLGSLAGLTPLFLQRTIGASTPPPPTITVAQYDTVEVPVPIKPVEAGTAIGKISFQTVSYPRHQVPENAVTDVTTLAGAVAIAPLPANLPLFRENFSFTDPNSNPVEKQIPPAMRAMTLRVDATSAVEGWAGSGAMVDVLLVTPNQTSVIAERVKVLSAERSTAPVGASDAPMVPSTVTILVTQEQCLAINMAIPLGKIAFALRNGDDIEPWSDPMLAAEKLKRSPKASPDGGKITGFISVKGDTKQFALRDGVWVKADTLSPEFSVSRGE